MRFFQLLIFISLLTSCIGSTPGGGGRAEDTPVDNQSNDNSSQDDQQQIDNNLNLVGTWSTPCFNDSGESQKTTWTIDDTESIFTVEDFTSEDCLLADKYQTISKTYSYSTTADEINLELTKYEITLNWNWWVDNENSAELCNHNDWVLNEIKDVTGESCSEGTFSLGDPEDFVAQRNDNDNTITIDGIDYDKI